LPRRIAIGPDDRVYIAAGNAVSVLDREGTQINDIGLGTEARCVAVAGDGTIYAGVRDHVEVFDSKGKRLATWDSPGKRTWFTGLAVGEKDVFAADAGNRVVLRYDKSGKLAGRIGERNKERNIPGLILPSPYLDVKLGSDGLLRVNNTGRHRVEAYTPSGDLEFSWGKPTNAIEGFCGCCNPVGLALLPDGRYVTCEKGLPRVKVYSSEGTFESVVAGAESFVENAKATFVKGTEDCRLGGLDAAVDSQQRIYILDLVANDVRVMKRKA
jgi:sugar lactone lactonase YvrE